MLRRILFQSDRFSLVSYGNGAAYALHDHANKRSLFVQDDDALELASEIESWEKVDPDLSYDEIYARVCDEYSSVMADA